MNTGTVKFYSDQKGFGFIQPESGSKDAFVHATALKCTGIRDLVKDQKAAFDTAKDYGGNKVAINNIQAA
ncbi:cold-shock protein [Microvirga roseola]|uniref:cold-shock protein n=1 Tax=Microvirga roseola TaxID=2883126 RepID=UPI001E3A3CEE|nr:cold-shock protein [Microvirga roseola]